MTIWSFLSYHHHHIHEVRRFSVLEIMSLHTSLSFIALSISAKCVLWSHCSILPVFFSLGLPLLCLLSTIPVATSFPFCSSYHMVEKKKLSNRFWGCVVCGFFKTIFGDILPVYVKHSFWKPHFCGLWLCLCFKHRYTFFWVLLLQCAHPFCCLQLNIKSLKRHLDDRIIAKGGMEMKANYMRKMNFF